MESNSDLTKHAQFIEQENLLMKERVHELMATVDLLNKNMPKKITKRMEKAAKLALLEELNALEGAGRSDACCSIS